MPNQKYTDEFKKEAVKMALESNETNAQIAENLGVKYKTLWNWIKRSMIKPETSNKSIDYKWACCINRNLAVLIQCLIQYQTKPSEYNLLA